MDSNTALDILSIVRLIGDRQDPGWRISADGFCRDAGVPLGSGQRRHAKQRRVCATQKFV